MIAYFDLPSGFSGDMMLGCLIDGGWDIRRLRESIGSLSLPPGEWAVQSEEVIKGSLRATQVNVMVEETTSRRNLADVSRIIADSSLFDSVKKQSIAVFARLARAEAKVHGTTPDMIHFHEVGALDAVIDIVGSVAGVQEMGIERVYASALPLGHGWTDSAHGPLPLPSPATLELLAGANAPARPAPGPGELLTPTGAALLAELATFTQPAMTLSRIGVGAGQRDRPWPNIARLWLGEAVAGGPLVQLETNIDDMNPQLYSAVSDKLFAAGARDVWLTAAQMKKGRPGVVLSVLANQACESTLADVILRETTTLGVRVHGPVHRHEAGREVREVMTEYGTVRAKLKWLGREPAGILPEFEDCRAIAAMRGVPVRLVHESAVAAAQMLLIQLRAATSAAKP